MRIAFALFLAIVFAGTGLGGLLLNGQDVCPHGNGWEKSDENPQHVTIEINGDEITFTPDSGYIIESICYKWATNIVFEVGPWSGSVTRSSGDGKDISHGAALMAVLSTSTPTDPPPTATPTDPPPTATPTDRTATPTDPPPTATQVPWTATPPPPPPTGPIIESALTKTEFMIPAYDISIPSIGIEAPVAEGRYDGDWIMSAFYYDGTHWPEFNLVGLHSPFYDELYDVEVGDLVYFNDEPYVVYETILIDFDATWILGQADLTVITCYGSNWNQRFVVYAETPSLLEVIPQ